MISRKLTVEKMEKVVRRWGDVGFQRWRGVRGEAGKEGARQGFLGDEIRLAGSSILCSDIWISPCSSDVLEK